MVARVIDILWAILCFCWKIFYWGSAAASLAVISGAIFAGYYLVKERHPNCRFPKSDNWIVTMATLILLCLIPLVNTACAYYMWSEHDRLVKEAVKAVAIKCGLAEDDIPF